MPPTQCGSTSLSLSDVRIGFIGLGLMGKPMALNLHKAGARMTIHNRSQGVVQDLATVGMTPAATPAEVAENAEIIILMLPDSNTVETILTGNGGILTRIKPDTLIIDMGTTDAMLTRALSQRIDATSSSFVDAPVSGGTIGAINASLSIMVGGNDEAVARAKPVLSCLGQSVVHVGPVGSGQVAKAANQVIVGLTISAVGEALKLAERAGADPAKVREALRGGFADSRILEVHGQRMIDEDFTPGGKCVTQRKDLFQALNLAAAYDLKLPTTREVMGQYDRLIAAGFGELDHAALIKVLDLD